MGEWRTRDGSYLRILDLQDGTSQIHAPSLGIHFKSVPVPLSNSPYSAAVPKSLLESARKAMSAVNPNCSDSSCGDPGGGSGNDTGTQYDDYGDSLTNDGGGMFELDAGGNSSDPYVFDTGNLYDDFGTDTLDMNMDGYSTLAATTVQPMTDECKAALRDLNAAFLNFVGMTLSVAAVVVAAGRFKIGKKPPTGAGPDDGFSDFSASFGDPAMFIGSIVDLNNKQNTVDNACAGQGAGRRPYG